jgi:hypothetical protein
MADATETVAVEAAVNAEASAHLATEAAVTAVEAAEVSAEVNAETVVTAAEAAVTLAETQAAIATQEAAQVIQAGVAAIAKNEEKESWQDEAIRSLQAGQITMSEALSQMGADLMGIKQAIVELVSPPSTQQQGTEAGSIPTVTTTEAIAESDTTQTEASPKSGDVSLEAQAKEKCRRVLRFL